MERDPYDNKSLTQAINTTLGRFVEPKRFVMLLVFGGLFYFFVYSVVFEFAKVQVVASVKTNHARLFQNFEKAVDRHRKLVSTVEKGMQIQNMVNSMNANRHGAFDQNSNVFQSTQDNPKNSPWWLALKDMRREYSNVRISILMSSGAMGSKEKDLLNKIKNKPRGYSLSDEDEGWSRTFYLLPTKNTAALSIYSYIKDDLNAWQAWAVKVGFYTFLMFFLFGWFWTRSLEDTTGQEKQQIFNKVSEKLQSIKKVTGEMGTFISDIKEGVQELERASEISANPNMKTLTETINHIQLLAINGSLEAARSPEANRVFQVLLQEINQLALKSKNLVNNFSAQDRAGLNAVHRKIEHFQDFLKKVG